MYVEKDVFVGVQEDFRVEVVVKPGLEGWMEQLDWETEEQHSERREQHTEAQRQEDVLCESVVQVSGAWGAA